MNKKMIVITISLIVAAPLLHAIGAPSTRLLERGSPSPTRPLTPDPESPRNALQNPYALTSPSTTCRNACVALTGAGLIIGFYVVLLRHLYPGQL